MKIKALLIPFLLGILFHGYTQNPNSTFYSTSDSLLKIIKGFQSKGDKYFDKGIFPSYRWYYKNNKIIKDDNIFYTLLINYTLNKLRPAFSDKGKAIVDEIYKSSTPNIKNYKNKDGKLSYNFWQTNPSKHFPNSTLFSKLKKFKIPDDIDVTSLVYLVKQNTGIDTIQKLHRLMSKHANLTKLKIRNTFSRYRDYPYYSTWFGKNMPIEMDICVLLNAMCMIEHYGLEYNKHDSACIHLINEVVLNKDHIKHATYMSPSYYNKNIILYHLARFIGDYKPAQLQKLKPQLIRDIKDALAETSSFMENVMLLTSLYRLGVREPYEVEFNKLENDLLNYNFFVANLVSSQVNFLKRNFSKSQFARIKYLCPVYNYCLLLEFVTYSKMVCNRDIILK